MQVFGVKIYMKNPLPEKLVKCRFRCYFWIQRTKIRGKKVNTSLDLSEK